VEIVTRADRPDLDEQAAVVFRERWPEFIFTTTCRSST